MATLRKIVTVQWVDASGKRVKPHTPGAKRVTVKSRKWYIHHKIAGKWKRIPAFTDKAASQAKLRNYLVAHERGEAGLTDPFKVHLDGDINGHLSDYLTILRSTTSSEDYQSEVERTLKRVFKETKSARLRDLTTDRIQKYLAGLPASSTTKNHHRKYIVGFFNYLEAAGRIARSPITRFNVKRFKAKPTEERRIRRALKPADLRKLLEAVRSYPLAARSTNSGGRHAKQKPATHAAKLKDATVEKLQRLGTERYLLYRIALLTGLRRIEISRLKVKHLDLSGRKIVLPPGLTKNRKAATLLLVPSLADELRQWVADKKPVEQVVSVPSTRNLSRIHKAALNLAGIPYKDDAGRFADFHSLRKSANAFLRKAGIPAKERQLFLRHGKLELTTETYDDASMVEMGDVITALSGL